MRFGLAVKGQADLSSRSAAVYHRDGGDQHEHSFGAKKRVCLLVNGERMSQPEFHRRYEVPGLWLDAAALLRLDSTRLMEVLKKGLASTAQAGFVKRLQAARRR
jgi:hypothetical protein